MTAQVSIQPTVADWYEAFADQSKRDWLTYKSVFRGKIETLTPDSAQGFVGDWLARYCPDLDAADLAARAQADARLNGLGLVAAALMALRAQLFEQAGTLAERAYATDQHEVFAQRIYLAALEERPDMHLAVDDWLEDRFCANPFTDVEIIGSKDVYTCCAAWLPAPLGSATQDIREIWEGPRAVELRRSILDGDFSYCSRLNCPKIATRELPRKSEVTDDALRKHIDRHVPLVVDPPDRVLLSYDQSCNLSCPSCRVMLISLGGRATAELDRFYDDHIAPLLADATRIKITGSGDPFGSKHFRHVLRALTDGPADIPRLQLQTNGVLFDERAWDDLGLEGHVKSVWISIDAAEPETYAVLRRDGDFERLIRNLEFLASKRAQDQIGELRIDFVVQAANFRQMPAFVELAQRIGADGVHFLMLRNWGTFSADEFRDMAVTFENHPQHYAFLNVLRDPRLDAPGIDLGNLEPLRQKALTGPLPRPVSYPAPKAKAVIVLGVPRIGSNYLFECLQSCRDIYVGSELFNPKAALGLAYYKRLGLAHFSTLLGREISDVFDPGLIDYVRHNPGQALQDIRHLADTIACKSALLKIFDDHLDANVLQDQILADEDVVPVILRRTLLPCYISWIKARNTQAWVKTDHTAFKPTVDPADYLQWQSKTLAWYADLESAVARHGQPQIDLTYEDIIAQRPLQLVTKLSGTLAHYGVTLTPPDADFDPPIPRQDRTDNVFDRVANGAELRNALEKAGQLDIALNLPPRLR